MESLCRICKKEVATRRIVTWDTRRIEFSLSMGGDVCKECGMNEIKRLNNKEIK